jgi:F-type H+-transporting ATPase subunit delta
LSATAQRYAAALADVALERKSADVVKRDFSAFVEMFFASTELRNALESPAVNDLAKTSVVEKIAAKTGMNDAARNFVLTIVENRRTHLLREIEKAFDTELNARMGIAEAEVTSARELGGPERAKLTQALEKRTGKKIEARFVEDKSLLGGAVVRVGSTIYDGSVREQLNRLREQLEAE